MSDTERDQNCTQLARAALFPSRYHRDVADARHFPALLVLDQLRTYLKATTPTSALYPRHVAVVRDLQSGDVQWNGKPDIVQGDGFDVIPNHVSVRSSSVCHKLVDKYRGQKALLLEKPIDVTAVAGVSANSPGRSMTEIVLCSDKIMHRDHEAMSKGKSDARSIAQDLPIRSFHAVEEVLAHQLVKIRHRLQVPTASDLTISVTAARAAECYFSKHEYQGRGHLRKGSKLPPGYSLLPTNSLRQWAMARCVRTVLKKEFSQGEKVLSDSSIEKAIRRALEDGDEGKGST